MSYLRIWPALGLSLVLWAASATSASADTMVWDAVHADADSYAQHSAGHAIWLPNLASIVGTSSWVFNDDGVFTEVDQMTAMLTGTIRPDNQVGDVPYGFVVSAHFRNDGTYAPSPKLELKPTAYAPGGPVDPTTWHYYEMPDAAIVTSTLTGTGAFSGLELTLKHKPADRRMGFQVGEGASGKNVLMGMSGWFYYDAVDVRRVTVGGRIGSGGGDFNINLTPTPEPGSFVLLAAALAGGLAYRRRRQRS